jgi:enoyl-[acyl-carrier protein] reductase II
LPLLAAGGIVNGAGMLAVRVLGAEGVQMGTRFAVTQESSASEAFKQLCLTLDEGDTKLMLKKLAPVRLIKNAFRDEVEAAEERGASAEELRELLGRGRAKQGILLGDLDAGELEIGQAVSLLKGRQVENVATVVDELRREYEECLGWLNKRRS